ncbi:MULTISPECIES: 3-hydroxyacyl-CoA dehydrogenase family protein [Actinomadura]|uniref:3-hydroxyacyl-CoA dehydrogenase family protein n=1 Tax=Actinomadura yumaensis TaxID=111807 RepID=A0ABW2CBT2_9ACTN|nr:3-hydroxyacyl-CoA dehydrogenase NAD-binding domain-containing protein [Actinomadura sp. J1-007]MWK38146.1 3-hydroxybutyryl-CoA dehydrogenase [Actinomadura sp. J1-007]
MKRIGVVGAGTMGAGVSQLFAAAGHEVVLVDVEASALDRAREAIARGVRLMPLVRPAEPRRDPDEVVGRVRFTTDLEELRAADRVVENVTEKWEVKRRLYPELDRICPPGATFGVNTSAIPITRIAALTRRPADVVGTHFMNPAPLKPTVEVIRGFHTSDRTVELTRELLAGAGRDCVVVSDSPGFVTNRVMMLTVNEAVFLLHEGVSTAGDVDRLFKECFGHAMGPLETADLIGLDTVLYSLEVLYGELNESKYRPCTLLRAMVDAGLLGRKSGRGFHTYEEGR